ncbi:Ig-like domain-containing protein [Deinococcus radiotolerans]|uniref:Bacterial Ig-like domain-containing protein n=1 Tax=Deinococcus radiotolerans TaxID=1309407 RepID=A0ABQ2FNA1_9DEIO|nr:Ig-like domain-containing protein [Deinococcus radiotolerans]GGL10863.1 hypothetical protein GCM10010844_31930 [Deinococcus radiotolerans]
MQNRIQLTLALTALTAALASCGTSTAPVAQLVKVDVAAPMGTLSGVQQGLSAQGFTGDAPTRHYDVTVRDSKGKVVAFNGTTYDPTGAGTTTLTLNDANQFKQTLLLPAGQYTFENKVKDDANNVLLGYGPGSENPGTVDAASTLIRLKSHAVLDPANTTLAPSMTLNELYTDTKFNLSLNLKTATFGAAMATVPTSDISAVTYTLGNVTDGVLNGAGSKVGVNVTSRGTDTDSELNVTASFSAWVQDSGRDTASYQPVSIAFAKQIQTNVMTTDTVMPTLSLNAAAPTVNTTATLAGTVGDDVMVQGVRVYVDGNLVASMDPSDNVAAVTGDSNGGWSAPWLVGAAGTYAVTVIAEDSSGNETRVDQSVTANDYQEINVTGGAYYQDFAFKAGVPQTFRINGARTYIYAWNYTWSAGSTLSGVLKNSAGQTLTTDPYYDANNDAELYNLTGAPGSYIFTVVSSVDQTVQIWAQ